MMDLPRHFFLDKAFEEWAYKDVPFRIEADQTISQPYTVAFQTQLLDIKSSDQVLEVGTGSGYQACILSSLKAKVYTIERQEALFHRTDRLLKKIGFTRIRTYLGDGYQGLPRYAPFQKIIVTAGATEIPHALVDQLDVNGIMVIPVGKDGNQKMIRIQKDQDGLVTQDIHGDFRFVPLLKGINNLDRSN
ncbi:UNVERIFIED_CONTAM: hypothetical protein GTU68_004408 [Idotea baltica]|nr:hypothetical protein [Idotea baltica]